MRSLNLTLGTTRSSTNKSIKMDNSKKFLKDNEILPRISFKEIPRHQVKLLKDKIDQIPGNTGEMVDGVNYFVEENGEKRSFFTSSISLIQKLSNCAIGDEVVITMKGKKTDSGFKSYFIVSKVGEEEGHPEEEPSAEDIPF